MLKHSNATRVHLDLVYQKREVQLCIFDDGHGFVGDPRPGASYGAGLNNMRKRAERMGGKLIVKQLARTRNTFDRSIATRHEFDGSFCNRVSGAPWRRVIRYGSISCLRPSPASTSRSAVEWSNR